MSQKVKFFELIRPNHNIDFVGKSKFFIALSVVLLLISFAILPLNRYVLKSRGDALHLSIDFRGGVEVKLKIEDAKATNNQISSALQVAGFKEPDVLKDQDHELYWLVRFPFVALLNKEQVQKLKAFTEKAVGKESFRSFNYLEGVEKVEISLKKEEPIKTIQNIFKEAGISVLPNQITSKPGSYILYEISLGKLTENLSLALEKQFGKNRVSIETTTSIGEKAGAELRNNGMIALVAAIGFIMLYILIRFDYRYAPGTVIALLHDAMLVVGAFALLYKEFSLATIAAILTVIGYSMNDTIVVFDRIRENTARYKDRDIRQIVNLSVNETLSRTILTSMTVFFVTLAMNIFGTGVIRDFGFAMNVGVIVGTYSSIFIASPVFIWLHERSKRKDKKKF